MLVNLGFWAELKFIRKKNKIHLSNVEKQLFLFSSTWKYLKEASTLQNVWSCTWMVVDLVVSVILFR